MICLAFQKVHNTNSLLGDLGRMCFQSKDTCEDHDDPTDSGHSDGDDSESDKSGRATTGNVHVHRTGWTRISGSTMSFQGVPIQIIKAVAYPDFFRRTLRTFSKRQLDQNPKEWSLM
jgi:hypothetical protein